MLRKNLTIKSVTCVQTSSGIVGDGIIAAIGALAGGAVGATVGVATTVGSAGTLALAGATAFVTGAGVGAGLSVKIKDLITSVIDLEDDLYIKAGTGKIFPKGDDIGIKSGQTIQVNKTILLGIPPGMKFGQVMITLMEKDLLGDDHLHSVAFSLLADGSVTVENRTKESSGSIYLIDFELKDFV